MSGFRRGYGPVLVASTPPGGTPLIDGTQTLVSYEVPPGGAQVGVIIVGSLAITGAETGGEVQVQWTCGGLTTTQTVQAGTTGTGVTSIGSHNTSYLLVMADPGSAVNVLQATALTAGAAVAYCRVYAL